MVGCPSLHAFVACASRLFFSGRETLAEANDMARGKIAVMAHFRYAHLCAHLLLCFFASRIVLCRDCLGEPLPYTDRALHTFEMYVESSLGL